MWRSPQRQAHTGFPPSARNGRAQISNGCLILEVKPTSKIRALTSAFDPSVWTGRVLQAGSDDLEIIGLALLYPAREWSVGAPGHHGYPRASDLILGKALRGRLGHQITGATARPFLHLLNPTRRPRQSIGRYGLALTPRPISHALRSCGPAPRPSRRSAPACWQEQLLERCDAAVSPRP